MVRINVAALLRSAPGTVRRLEFSEPLEDVPVSELRLAGPVAGDLKLTRTTQGILAQVAFRAPVQAECARCVDPIEVSVDGSFEEEFLPTTEVSGAFTLVPLDEGELEPDQPRIDEDYAIDLDEMLRQETLTALPVRPLCDTACPGLCPECGERLTPAHRRVHGADERVETQPADTHQPFSRLAELLRERDDSS